MDFPTTTKHDEIKPLAPVNIIIEDTNNIIISSDHFNRHDNNVNKTYFKCCGCIAALTLIISVTILILFFTAFHIKNPILKLNSFTIHGLGINNDANFTIIADVSIKNPNMVAFKFGNATTHVYYRGKVTGECRSSARESKAKGTMRMNMTVEIMAEKLLEDSNFRNDVKKEELRIDSYTIVKGRVKITRIIKKDVTLTINCTININVKSMSILSHDCHK